MRARNLQPLARSSISGWLRPFPSPMARRCAPCDCKFPTTGMDEMLKTKQGTRTATRRRYGVAIQDKQLDVFDAICGRGCRGYAREVEEAGCGVLYAADQDGTRYYHDL